MARLTLASPLLLLVTCVLVNSQNDIRKPPNINTPNREQKLYYTLGTKVVVKCQAEGQPTPTYKWMSNGAVITPNDLISYDSTTGDLTIPDFTKREEATYMCIASNVFDNSEGGRITASSFSPPVTLFQIRVSPFLPVDDVTRQASEYAYVKQTCSGKGEVVADDLVYNWYMDKDSAEVTMDGGRLYVDREGNLHFSYVLMKDATSNFHYLCGISSATNKVIVLGNSNYLTVTSVPNPTAIKPRLQYSNSNTKVLRFGVARLECVFSGYDPVTPHIPVTRWYDDAGVEITSSTNPNKYTLSNDRRMLTIRNVQEEDEKNYYCEADNQAGNSGKQAVFLDVTSAPIFRIPGAPIDQTVSEDNDVVFLCDARSASNEAEPGPPTWYINGQKTGAHTDRSKYVMSDNNKKMTIKSVKKASDILCVQCEVTNKVGTTWGDACLNVILPIRLEKVPPSRQDIKKGDDVDLTISATTDPSMTLSYKWEFKNETWVGTDHPPQMFYDPTTFLAYINTSTLSDDEYKQIGGVYRRVIYHQFETKTVEVNVVLDDQEPAAAVASASIDMWIIGLIIGLIFLIIVIIIIIFVICRKQQEGDYNVDKKETGAGLDPEKELKDKGFNDYSRPDYDDYDFPEKKPRGELEYDDVPIGGDDESLGEYGDEDDTHFNEDGSFIGIYQKKPPPPQPQATESTI